MITTATTTSVCSQRPPVFSVHNGHHDHNGHQYPRSQRPPWSERPPMVLFTTVVTMATKLHNVSEFYMFITATLRVDHNGNNGHQYSPFTMAAAITTTTHVCVHNGHRGYNGRSFVVCYVYAGLQLGLVNIFFRG